MDSSLDRIRQKYQYYPIRVVLLALERCRLRTCSYPCLGTNCLIQAITLALGLHPVRATRTYWSGKWWVSSRRIMRWLPKPTSPIRVHRQLLLLLREPPTVCTVGMHAWGRLSKISRSLRRDTTRVGHQPFVRKDLNQLWFSQYNRSIKVNQLGHQPERIISQSSNRLWWIKRPLGCP
jgi:hypothetical protein